MGLFDFLRGGRALGGQRPQASTGMAFTGLDDPALLEFLRTGGTGVGCSVSVDQALSNPAVWRCVELVSNSIAMLPTYVMRKTAGALEKAEDHPLFDLLLFQPNGWQTAYEFKQLMQAWALIHGNAYAVIVRTGARITQFVPVDPRRVQVTQRPDLTVEYQVGRADGSIGYYEASDVLHLRGLSLNGLTGLSRVQKAAETITIALQAGRAAERVFRNGMMVGGNLKHPGKLGDDGRKFLRDSLNEIHAGPENAGKWIITEEGMEAKPFASTAKDGQLIEVRTSLVEDIARIFGVPRPLMIMGDTSWGSGIEQLGILFVRYGLASWFKAWEEALARACLTPAERRAIAFDFDETELLRGTLKDQADFYAKALGAGGQRPWMEVNEVRESVGLGAHPDGGGLISAGETRNVAP